METNSLFQIATSFNLAEQVDYSNGGVTRKQITKTESGNLTLFAFDKGQGLSAHTVQLDAIVQVLEGEALIHIGEKPNIVKAGEMIIMPAHVPHSLHATVRFKMLLTRIKG